MRAAPADIPHAALDNQEIFPLSPHKNTCQASLMIKRLLIQPGISPCQRCKVSFLSRHGAAPENGRVQRIPGTGVIQTVQIGIIQRLCALIAENVHIVFQQNGIAGQGSRLVHAERIHAAEALHRVHILDDDPLPFHDGAAPGKAGGDHHGQHLGNKPHGHGKSEGKRQSPVAPHQSADNKDNRHQNGHETEQNPCYGGGAAVEAVPAVSRHVRHVTTGRIPAHGQCDAGSLAAHNQ